MNDQEVTPVFGIDLGTTYSCIAYVDDEQSKVVVIPNSEGDRTTPSVVMFENDNRVVGKGARNSAILNPDQVIEMVKRHMGDTNWRFTYNGIEHSAEKISSYILSKLADDAEQYLGYPVKDVVITCPAYFSIAQRDATARAGKIAGLNVREVINEPTAVALIYGLQNEQDQMVLVYNLGGGTSSITAIKVKDGVITVVVSGSDHNFGGHHWDESLIIYLAEQWKAETGSSDDPTASEQTLQDLWNSAEQAKQVLTVQQETKVVVTHAGQSVKIPLTREKFDELTTNLLMRTVQFMKMTMEEVKSRGFTHFDRILLIGGSTRMPQVAERLTKEFNLPLRVFDPDEAIAKGAALYGYLTYMRREGSQIETEMPIVLSDKQPVLTSKFQWINQTTLKTCPNFFLLLNLNPTASWKDDGFLQALDNKFSEWIRQKNEFTQKTPLIERYQYLLPNIWHIMKTPALREREAKAAQLQLNSCFKDKEDFEQKKIYSFGKNYTERKDKNQQPLRCDSCHKMNERSSNHCSRCNEKLLITCPNCDHLVTIDEEECNECVFPIGKRYWVDKLLEKCEEQIQKHDFRNVQDHLNEVEALWKPYRPDARVKKLKTLKAELQKIERETSAHNVAIYGPVQGFVQGDNNTITLTFQNNYQHTIPFLAPHQPSDLIGREQLLHDLKQQLFKSESSAPSVLNGLPGVGKTALALTLAHDYEILGHFYDGILWAGLGREANIIPHLGAWAVALGISPAEIERLTMQRNQLAQAIYKAIGLRKMLLIVDDVWKIEDALAFKRGGPNCVHLITTRLPEVAAQLTNQKITLVDELDEANGLKLLEQCTPGIMTTAPEQARELVHMVGGLPLPLTLMGNYLRIHIRTGQPRRLRSALDRLQQVEERLRLKQPRDILEPYPSLPEEAPLSLRAVIQISDEALDEQTQQVLHALSLFPAKPNTFSEEAILEVAATTTDIIDKLTDSGLLEISGPDRYTLHQTISDYAKTQFNDKDAYERMVKYFIQYIKSCNGNNRLLERETSNMLAALEFMYEYEIRVDGAKAFAVFMSYLRKNRHM